MLGKKLGMSDFSARSSRRAPAQTRSLIIWILIAAGVISGALGEMVDAIAILAIVVLNAVIGFYQELNAEKSIAALKKMTAPQAKVRRVIPLVVLETVKIVRTPGRKND